MGNFQVLLFTCYDRNLGIEEQESETVLKIQKTPLSKRTLSINTADHISIEPSHLSSRSSITEFDADTNYRALEINSKTFDLSLYSTSNSPGKYLMKKPYSKNYMKDSLNLVSEMKSDHLSNTPKENENRNRKPSPLQYRKKLALKRKTAFVINPYTLLK